MKRNGNKINCIARISNDKLTKSQERRLELKSGKETLGAKPNLFGLQYK